MRYLPAIIIAIAVLLAPLIWHFSTSLFSPGGGSGGSAVDSQARIEVELLRGQVDALQERLLTLDARVGNISANQGQGARREVAPDESGYVADGDNDIIDAYAQVVLVADRRTLNKGLTVAGSSFMESFLGRPRETVDDECRAMTNEKLAAMLALEDVGPIRARMLHPAAESLRAVFDNVRRTDPDLYERINTSGSLCVRRIRGTQNSLSNHSFGTALDLNIDDVLDGFADGRTQLGLTILADFFNQEGWIWGAGFGREDSMHFEVSRDLLERWREEGRI
jgi:hypothetical protein